MFRDRVLRWTRMIDLFAVPKETIVVLAKRKPRSPQSVAPVLKSRDTLLQETRVAAQRELAMARLHSASFNR